MKGTDWIVIVILGVALGVASVLGFQRFDNLSKRVEELEEQLAPAGTAPAVVRANHFVMIDGRGKARARLAMFAGGPRLVMYDDNARPRIGLGVWANGPRLELYDERGKLAWTAPGRR